MIDWYRSHFSTMIYTELVGGITFFPRTVHIREVFFLYVGGGEDRSNINKKSQLSYYIVKLKI